MEFCVQNKLSYSKMPFISTLEINLKLVFIETSEDQLQVNKYYSYWSYLQISKNRYQVH